MLRIKTLLTVIGAATILVLAGNTVALAATGHSFILGKTNKANTVSTLKRTTNGPALNLVTKPSNTAPFSVNSNGKVANLNADSLDGQDSSAFAPSSLSGQVGSIASNTPIARGFINTGAGGTAPTIATGSTGVSAVSWDAGNTRYELTVTGQSYFFNDFVTIITGTCANLPPTSSSVSGHLLAIFGAGAPCAGGGGFAYVIYKIH
ncbi:MAG: hypothetical protein JF565_08920 [Propionibacteriales bacterium]|nr:hypothetical protein [Propionibacteriales bacterium]